MHFIRRVLRGLLLSVLLLIGAALFYILVIMGDTGPGETPGAAVVEYEEGGRPGAP